MDCNIVHDRALYAAAIQQVISGTHGVPHLENA